MLGSMSQWLGFQTDDSEITAEDKPNPKDSNVNTKSAESKESFEKSDEAEVVTGETNSTESDAQQAGNTIQEQLDEVSSLAINSAKSIGSYLYNFSVGATDKVGVSKESVIKSALKVKETVEGKNILSDFHNQQKSFISEKLDKKCKEETAVAPWVGYASEDNLKSQILLLSTDKRNFLRRPPAGVAFTFDLTTTSPVAMVMLSEDSNLEKMRFELVPKQIKEEHFWRNYFYRVSLIKQSAELTSISIPDSKPESHSGETNSSRGSRRSSLDSLKAEIEAAKEESLLEEKEESGEFASDALEDADELNCDQLRKEMQQLGVGSKDKSEESPEWEKELRAEIGDYELVDEAGDIDDDALEKEIMQQLDNELS